MLKISQKTLQAIGVSAFYGSLFVIPFAVAAWNTTQSADAICTPSGLAAIDVRFTNTESDKDLAMNVVAQDNQTHNLVSFGTVEPKETKTGEIETVKTSLENDSVTFTLKWANGKPGTDTRTASYGAVNCKPPTPTPTPQPTATPTPIPTVTVIPTSQPTVTPQPTTITTPTPTEVPTVTPIPTNQNNNTNNNTSNNTNTNNNNPVINISQNVEQHTGDVNVTQTTQPAIVAATNETITETPTPTPQQVQSVSPATQLPGTGPETNGIVALFSLLPVGAVIRKLARKIA